MLYIHVIYTKCVHLSTNVYAKFHKFKFVILIEYVTSGGSRKQGVQSRRGVVLRF